MFVGQGTADTQKDSQILKEVWTPHLLKKERKEARLEGGKRNKGKLEEQTMVIDIPSFLFGCFNNLKEEETGVDVCPLIWLQGCNKRKE